MDNKKAQLQISFAWLFAIIVGAFILFLAIYGVTQLIRTGETATSAQTGAEIGVLLNPLETGFETSRTTLLTMPVNTRIHNRCLVDSGNFGRQIIQLSQISFNRWTETDIDIGFTNKYLFSDSIVEGKTFLLFSKSFDFPFKVSDVIYVTSAEKSYCFVDAPSRLENELTDLNQENILLDNCSENENSIKVCFSAFGSDCDIRVNEALKSVEKRGETLYYETDALLYGAIFADSEIYECQTQRLIQRAEQITLLYSDKTQIQSFQGCQADVNLASFSNSLSSYRSSSDLIFSSEIARTIDAQNRVAECELW